MGDRRHQWANLPKELVEKIGEHLDSRVDLLRLRSVCNSWRSSVALPSFDEQLPRMILSLPHPLRNLSFISRTLICRIELTHQNSTSSSPSKGWLTKVGESKTGKLQLLNPISDFQIRNSPITLNLLDFRFIEMGKAFKLKLANQDVFSLYGVQKAVPFQISTSSVEDGLAMVNEYSLFAVPKTVPYPISASWGEDEFGNLDGSISELEDEELDNLNGSISAQPGVEELGNLDGFSILAIYQGGKLGYWLYGSNTWDLLDDTNFQYDDIIAYKGRFYVVDRWGTVSWIDSSLNVNRYSPLIHSHGGDKKTLVESCGDLYVVDRYFHKKRSNHDEDIFYRNFRPQYRGKESNSNSETVDFRVYKLDEEWGRWVEVKALGDRVFVLGIDCSFSVSSDEFVGGKGNCIYFSDDDESGVSSENVQIQVFQLEDRSFKELEEFPEYSEIFWPPK